MIKFLNKIGKVVPKTSQEINTSPFSLGFEKLDRDVFDPEKAYDFVAQVGVKRARLQSGWQRTEKEKGVYDFSWLDKVVDNLLERKIQPWLCLCYGNQLYSPEAKEVFGAVGIPPVHTQEEKEAWVNYVKATVSHYKGRIKEYEVWNEPDGKWCWKHGPNGTELGEFVKMTAIACHEANPECKVVGFAACMSDEKFLDEVAATGCMEHVDGLTYHAYTVWEDNVISINRLYRKFADKYGKNLPLWQGESGAQSRPDGAGAMHGANWSPELQTKYLLRHLLCDLSMGVEVASYFSCMDMIEALNGKVDDVNSYLDYGYFGILGADFDENGKSVGTYSPKPSFYALQTLCTVFSEKYEMIPSFSESKIEYSPRLFSNDYDFNKISTFCAKRENGSKIMTYWAPLLYLEETLNSTCTLCFEGEEVPVLINLADGTVYEIPKEQVLYEDGKTVLKNIPVADTPYALMWGDFAEYEKT